MTFIVFFTIIVLVFYLIIPGTGAFYARKQWKDFRRNIIMSGFYPVLDYYRFRKNGDDELPGLYRFFGKIEAIQDENKIWLRKGNFTVTADLENVKIFIVRSGISEFADNSFFEKAGNSIEDEMPQVISWNRIFSLPENSEMMISGPLFRKGGKGIFSSTKTEKLTVILFDGSRETLLKRAVWSGRHRNEFWNFLTPVSIITGAFILFIGTYTISGGLYPDFLCLISLTFSLLPVIPLFPPGVVFFFLYRRLWKEARFIRAERDISALPLRFFSKDDFSLSQKTVNITDEISYSFRKIYGRDEAERICREKNVRIRENSADRCTGDYFYYFYSSRSDNKEYNSDPMLENIILCNNPGISNIKCNEAARKKEFQSIVVFSAGLAVNFIFVFYLLSLII